VNQPFTTHLLPQKNVSGNKTAVDVLRKWTAASNARNKNIIQNGAYFPGTDILPSLK